MFWYTTTATAVPQLLGVERNDGGNAGDAFSQESGDHGRAVDAGVQRAGKMGAGSVTGKKLQVPVPL